MLKLHGFLPLSLAAGVACLTACGGARLGPGDQCQSENCTPYPSGPFTERVGPLVRLVLVELGMSRPRSKGETEVPSESDPPKRTKGTDDLVAAYRRAAPATVLIRTPSSYGSGIILSSDGKILTNAHVVRDAMSQDLKQLVLVRLGRLDERTGRMLLDPKEYSAHVYSVDASVDLALIKLQDPPSGLTTMPLSAAEPRPGQSVASLGHAAVGLLWAIKPGSVSAIGKFSDASAILTGFGCGDSPAETPYEFCRAAETGLEGQRRELDAMNTGTVIQSTCPIGQGDSGGPLVALDGTLLGVNQLRIATDGGIAQYHVGLDTIQSFLAQIPTTPLSAAPDPLTQGSQIVLADADSDGAPDTLASADGEGSLVSLQVDLDQSSFVPGARVPTVRELVSRRAFEIELTVVKTGHGYTIFHDTDNDGSLDTMLFEELEEGALPRFGVYRRAPGQDWERSDSTTPQAWKRGDFVPEALRERFQKIFSN